MSLLRTAKGKPTKSATARCRHFVPQLLVLEDRTLPSTFSSLLNTISTTINQVIASFAPSTPTPMTFTVTNTNDSGPGSLRRAINLANANPGSDVIVFQAGLTGTIALSSQL